RRELDAREAFELALRTRHRMLHGADIHLRHIGSGAGAAVGHVERYRVEREARVVLARTLPRYGQAPGEIRIAEEQIGERRAAFLAWIPCSNQRAGAFEPWS